MIGLGKVRETADAVAGQFAAAAEDTKTAMLGLAALGLAALAVAVVALVMAVRGRKQEALEGLA